MRDGANETGRLLSQFTVVLTVVDLSQRPIPVELIDRGEINTVLVHILLTLFFIPIVAHSPIPFHIYLCMQLNWLTRAAGTRPPYHRIAAAPPPRTPRAPRTQHPSPPPPR